MSDEQMGGGGNEEVGVGEGRVLNKLLQVMKTDVGKKVLEKYTFANLK